MIAEELVTIQAGTASLHARLAYDEDAIPRFITIVAPPHPLLGGTIDNPVLLAIIRGVAMAGGIALAWEYRSTRLEREASELAIMREAFWLDPNKATSLEEHCDEARCCIRWLHSQMSWSSKLPVAFAGYSYGGALAILLAGEGDRALAVSPPLGVLAGSPPLRCRSISIVLAENDLAVNTEDWREFHEQHEFRMAEEVTLAGEDHFLRNSIGDIQSIAQNWGETVTSLSCPGQLPNEDVNSLPSLKVLS